MTRSTKAQREAVRKVLENAHKAGDLEALVANVTEAAISAHDGKTMWVVLTKLDSGVIAWGPYAAASTARRAIARGLVGADQGVMMLAMRPK